MATPVSAKIPSASDYVDALQAPDLCFQDPLLKAGQPICNTSGLPHLISGNFAGVCEMRNGAQHWAVRCFLRQASDRERHYNIIYQHLKARRLPNLAGFEYLQQGIRVKREWYPIVKMEWVEGESLHTFVERHLHNSQVLLNLATEWRVLLRSLHAHQVAHGDLQHDNVRVTPQGHLRLIDYDGMFAPVFRGELSPENGHKNFQHPLRTIHDYNEDLDNFSALVIYTSLLVLATDPNLWQPHHTGENLIFSADDYKAPQQSVILQELMQSINPEVQKLAFQVEQCCVGTMAQVPKLDVAIATPNVPLRPVTATTTLQPQSSVQQSSVNLKPSLQFESVVFYDRDRGYSTYFPQSITRYIGFKLNTRNVFYSKHSKGERTYQLAWHYYRPDGSLMGGNNDETWVIPSDTDWTYCYRECGWDEPGQWEPGIYRVEILIDGVEFAEGLFGIIHSLKGWNSNLELVSLRFYERGWDPCNGWECRSSMYFPQSITRYIFIDINVRNYYKLGDRVYKMKWRCYNSTGNLVEERQQDWTVKADWSSCSFTAWLGSKKPGAWEPGNYRLILFIDDVEFAEGTFTIEQS